MDYKGRNLNNGGLLDGVLLFQSFHTMYRWFLYIFREQISMPGIYFQWCFVVYSSQVLSFKLVFVLHIAVD